MIDFLGQSGYFSVVLSLCAYGIGLWLKKKTKHPLCNPLLVAVFLVIGVLIWANIPYETYLQGGKNLSYLLTPATVALAIPLYRQMEAFRQNYLAILSGIFAGVLGNLGTIYVLSRYFALEPAMYITLLPKSITTAIGLDVSAEYGGFVGITATAIILTGIFGSVLGESLCKIFKIQNPVAKGVAFGSSAHAVGTSKAMELGETEGAMSSLSIVLTGFCTLLLVGYFVSLY